MKKNGNQDCGCGPAPPSNLPPGVDSRAPLSAALRAVGPPVLGPHLGGGISSAGLNEAASLPTPGGGFTPAITHVAADVVQYPQRRQDFRFDFSTPAQLYARQRPENSALVRGLGGLV